LAFDVQTFGSLIEAWSGGRRPALKVGFSGGLDSSVLLAASAEAFPEAVEAIHVDHGLHPASSAWGLHCVDQAAALGVGCRVIRVDAQKAPGESPEAAARAARYEALGSLLCAGDVLLTAHHADDQLETVILQMMRGCGVAGLAAMPERSGLGAGELWRPLLGYSRQELADWAAGQGLSWVDDPANRDTRLARNHLRHELVPALKAYWPAAADAVSRTARHCAEAAAVLAELAAEDAAGCGDGRTLAIEGLLALTPARRRNLVRWQAVRLGLPVPDHRRLETLLAQLEAAAPDASPRVRWPGAVALRHQGRLYLLPESCLAEPPGTLPWPDPSRPLALGAGLGSLSLEDSEEGGLDPRALREGDWSVGFRGGGERLRLPGRSHRTQLKKLFHEAGVPPWERARTPLVSVAGRLAAVGESWVAAEWWSPPGNKALRVSWHRPGGAG
jgi:tRNA(Ile)-lysidine synthase